MDKSLQYLYRKLPETWDDFELKFEVAFISSNDADYECLSNYDSDNSEIWVRQYMKLAYFKSIDKRLPDLNLIDFVCKLYNVDTQTLLDKVEDVKQQAKLRLQAQSVSYLTEKLPVANENVRRVLSGVEFYDITDNRWEVDLRKCSLIFKQPGVISVAGYIRNYYDERNYYFELHNDLRRPQTATTLKVKDTSTSFIRIDLNTIYYN